MWCFEICRARGGIGNCEVDGVTFAEFMAWWNALEENLGTDVMEYTPIP
jgi:hypothetical protein